MIFPLRILVSALLGLAFHSAILGGQVAPNAHWRTIKTEHFYITFTPELEEIARRGAADAERAYAELAQHLHPPRGMIDVVISDDVDFTNGSATPFPSNRIVMYANPPVFESALRFVDDPTQLILTHELTHIFHLDRVGGPWTALQKVFGRNPFLFPNLYQPSWLVEGIAVYYESYLTGSGRVEGSEHRMIARTAALAHAFPRIDQLSLANPHFPYGYSVYAYGSLFVDHLARTYGDSAVRAFIEASSRQIIPILLDRPARRAFGRSFTSAYRSWATSLVAEAPPAAPPIPGWRDLTVDGAYTSFPRWLNDSTIIYTGAPARESYGAFKLTLSGHRKRLGRRNSRTPNSILADSSLLFSQLEYLDPFHARSDLYTEGARGGEKRLTHGARLAFPDARADGLIVAVHTLPGGSQLALVSSDGRHVTSITNGSPDEQWTEPRWSPDGKHIAAVRWTHGGTSSLLVLDTAGRIEQTLMRDRAVNASPSWSWDGRSVYFSSDRTGVPNLYRASFAAAFADTLMIPDPVMLSDAQTGLFEPQPNNEGMLTAVVFKADGYHIGVAPLDSTRPHSAQRIQAVEPREPAPVIADRAAIATKYSPWRTLAPRYWIPFAEPSLGSGARIGAYTSGEDVVGRHRYETLVFVPTDNSGVTGSFAYRNASFGQPLIEAVASQDWENYRCIRDASQQGACVGTLRRRIRDASLSMTLLRPRVRHSAYLSAGAGVESRDYATNPRPLAARIDSQFQRTVNYPRVSLSAGWGNTQYPPLAISPEDGISLASTARFRWLQGDTTTGALSVIGSAAAFKSLDLPGYAHHALALRGAYGYMTTRNTGYFEVGGVSGGTLDVLPGYVLGEGRRTFGVRGFPTAFLQGTRAFTANAEYRAPLTLPGRGLGLWPVFLDRTSVTVFGDAGSAWCPSVFAPRAAPITSLCTQSDVDGRFVFLSPRLIASAGAELNVSAAVFAWDTPFRYRVGVAAPVLNRTLAFAADPVTVYFAVGASF